MKGGDQAYRLERVDEEGDSDRLLTLVPLVVLQERRMTWLSTRMIRSSQHDGLLLTRSTSAMKTQYSLVLPETGLRTTALDSLPIVKLVYLIC
jgi:hypothetical protein